VTLSPSSVAFSSTEVPESMRPSAISESINVFGSKPCSDTAFCDGTLAVNPIFTSWFPLPSKHWCCSRGRKPHPSWISRQSVVDIETSDDSPDSSPAISSAFCEFRLLERMRRFHFFLALKDSLNTVKTTQKDFWSPLLSTSGIFILISSKK